MFDDVTVSGDGNLHYIDNIDVQDADIDVGRLVSSTTQFSEYVKCHPRRTASETAMLTDFNGTT